jgi:hypothetical protein
MDERQLDYYRTYAKNPVSEKIRGSMREILAEKQGFWQPCLSPVLSTILLKPQVAK